jgi:hypothetical protein
VAAFLLAVWEAPKPAGDFSLGLTTKFHQEISVVDVKNYGVSLVLFLFGASLNK